MLSIATFAQDKLFAVVELMEVDNDQESAYAETEAFWEKIHQQRVNNGEIIGWDLWQLLPGGEDQGYQYATVTLYSSRAAMFKSTDWMTYAKRAYPKMSDKQINDKMNQAGNTRDLAVRIFLERVARTDGDFDMKIGTMATFDWMKVSLEDWQEYESIEQEIFQPMHQAEVDNGSKGSWSLMRYVSPIGSDTYASHVTVNMFKDADNMFADYNAPGLTKVQQMAVSRGLESRDLKMVTVAQLLRKVRK